MKQCPESVAINRDDFERLFTRFDANGDRKISPPELQLLMNTIGEELTPQDAEAMLQSADSDGDGLLDMEEFMRMAGFVDDEDEIVEQEDNHLREAFKLYEMDGQGCITARSLKRMLSRLGTSRPVDECRLMISRFDLNGDGVLCFEEFRAMMML